MVADNEAMPVTRKASFAVGTQAGPQSCVWTIKTTANGDIYFMCRQVGGDFKVSFHPPNATHPTPIWRAALTSEHMQRPDALRPLTASRVLHEWPHPETEFAPGVKRVFGVVIPEAAISMSPVTAMRSLNLLTPPPSGKWTLLWVWIARHVVSWPPPGGESTGNVAALLLPDGEWLSVTHHHIAPVDMSDLPAAIPAEVATAILAANDPRMIVHATFDGVEVWVESKVQLVTDHGG